MKRLLWNCKFKGGKVWQKRRGFYKGWEEVRQKKIKKLYLAIQENHIKRRKKNSYYEIIDLKGVNSMERKIEIDEKDRLKKHMLLDKLMVVI